MSRRDLRLPPLSTSPTSSKGIAKSSRSKGVQVPADPGRIQGAGPFGTFIEKNRVEAGLGKRAPPGVWASAVKSALGSVNMLTYVSRPVIGKMLK